MKKQWKNGAKKRQMSWNPKNAKNLEFVSFIFHFLSFFFHFFVLRSESLDFAKCSSFFPNFLVENAAKHRKSMNKNKENDEKWIEMMKNGQCTIKIWKANDKKNEK